MEYYTYPYIGHGCVNNNFGNGNTVQQQIPLPMPHSHTTLQHASVGQASMHPVSVPEKKKPGPKPNGSPKVEKPKRRVGRPSNSKDQVKRAPRGSLPANGASERKSYDHVKRERKAEEDALPHAPAPSSSQEEEEPKSLPKRQRRQATPSPSEEEDLTDISAQDSFEWASPSQEPAPLVQQHQNWPSYTTGFDQGLTALSAPSSFDFDTSSFIPPDSSDDDFFATASRLSVAPFTGTSFGWGLPS
jgi:hypothetical protein